MERPPDAMRLLGVPQDPPDDMPGRGRQTDTLPLWRSNATGHVGGQVRRDRLDE
jgi:hypothetical protein